MFDLLSFLMFFTKLRQLRRQAKSGQLTKSDKADIIIKKALEGYRPLAAEHVKSDLCAECRDRRCERGIHCKAYDDAINERAWEMVSGENN